MKSISPYMGPSKIIAFVHMVVGLLKKSCSCGAWDEPGNPMGKLETGCSHGTKGRAQGSCPSTPWPMAHGPSVTSSFAIVPPRQVLEEP